jgi:hypothetical protein
MIKQTFKKISSDDDIRLVIKSSFNVDLNISGGWGYDEESAIILLDSNYPTKQLEHTLASMRAHLEMNMTQPQEMRYGAINVNEIKREIFKSDIRKYDIITFKISAILEETYNKFIQEYKAGQDSVDFDIEAHFRKRKDATLIREEKLWFNTSNLKT